MARTIDAAKRVISGTFGEVWLDGEKVAECMGCQGKLAKNKEKIYLCGQLISDHKVMSMDGTGSLTLYKVAERRPEWRGPAVYHCVRLERPGQLRSGADCFLQCQL